MCGGGGGAGPPKKQPPPPEPPPELILDAEGSKRRKGLADRGRKLRGRNTLVNSALTIGSGASLRPLTSTSSGLTIPPR